MYRGGYAWESTAHKGTHRIPNFECGTAGIGATLLQMYLFEQHKAGWYRFIDDPYPTWLNE